MASSVTKTINEICQVCNKTTEGDSSRVTLAFPNSKVETTRKRAFYHLECSQSLYRNPSLLSKLVTASPAPTAAPVETKRNDDGKTDEVGELDAETGNLVDQLTAAFEAADANASEPED
jgi:hypothetical protein